MSNCPVKRKSAAVQTLKHFMSDWRSLGLTETIEVEFNGSGDDGTLEVVSLPIETRLVLEAKGYAFGWLENDFPVERPDGTFFVMLQEAKKGLLGLCFCLLKPGWECQDGSSGLIRLDIVKGQIRLDMMEYYLKHPDDFAYSDHETEEVL